MSGKICLEKLVADRKLTLGNYDLDEWTYTNVMKNFFLLVSPHRSLFQIIG